MKKKIHNNILVPMACLLVFGAGMATVVCSCTTDDIPQKLLPAYYFGIQFPEGESPDTITIMRGKSVIVPVLVTSNSDVPISIRLAQDDQRELPEAVIFNSPSDFVTIQPGEETTINVTYHVSELATPGNYNTGIHGELQEQVSDRSLLTQHFSLVITD